MLIGMLSHLNICIGAHKFAESLFLVIVLLSRATGVSPCWWLENSYIHALYIYIFVFFTFLREASWGALRDGSLAEACRSNWAQETSHETRRYRLDQGMIRELRASREKSHWHMKHRNHQPGRPDSFE